MAPCPYIPYNADRTCFHLAQQGDCWQIAYRRPWTALFLGIMGMGLMYIFRPFLGDLTFALRQMPVHTWQDRLLVWTPFIAFALFPLMLLGGSVYHICLQEIWLCPDGLKRSCSLGSVSLCLFKIARGDVYDVFHTQRVRHSRNGTYYTRVVVIQLQNWREKIITQGLNEENSDWLARTIERWHGDRPQRLIWEEADPP